MSLQTGPMPWIWLHRNSSNEWNIQTLSTRTPPSFCKCPWQYFQRWYSLRWFQYDHGYWCLHFRAYFVLVLEASTGLIRSIFSRSRAEMGPDHDENRGRWARNRNSTFFPGNSSHKTWRWEWLFVNYLKKKVIEVIWHNQLYWLLK